MAQLFNAALVASGLKATQLTLHALQLGKPKEVGRLILSAPAYGISPAVAYTGSSAWKV